MPKDDEELDEKKEVKKIIDEIANDNPDLSEDDYKTLVQAIDTIFKQKKEGLVKKICRISLSFVLKYIVMFLCMTIIASMFLAHVVINKQFIFVVTLIASLPLTFIFASQLFGVGSFQKRFLTKFFLANLLVIIIMCLINYYQIRVFKFSFDWVFVEILTGALFMAVDYYLSIKIPFY